MATRSKGHPNRYDTREILLRLGRDRKRSILVFCMGSLALAAASLYFVRASRRAAGEVAVVAAPRVVAPPASAFAPAPPPAVPPNPTAPPAHSAPKSVLTPVAPPPPPAAAAPTPAPVRLTIGLSKAAPLWCDGKALGIKKQIELDMNPGRHELRARFGRKTLSTSIVAEQQALSVYFDAKRRKVVVAPAK